MWCCPVVEVGLKTKHKILIAPTKASVKCVTAYIRLWLVILWLWCVMLLFWLLLRSLVGYCCACGLLMWLCCCAIGDIHTGVKSGCKLVTLLSFLWYDKLWGPSQRVVTLFCIIFTPCFFFALYKSSLATLGEKDFANNATTTIGTQRKAKFLVKASV